MFNGRLTILSRKRSGNAAIVAGYEQIGAWLGITRDQARYKASAGLMPQAKLGTAAVTVDRGGSLYEGSILNLNPMVS
jgi:hypothetical protein